MGSQQAARSHVHGLLKNLTSSSEHEACHLLEWLEAFSERLMNRADEVTAEVSKLVESTEVVEQELHNTFNAFRGLSSSQFVENYVYEEDETVFIHEESKVQEQGIPSQSYENDIVPRYKEAVASARSIYEQHICKPYKRSSGPHKSRMLAERWHKHLPHIIGTEDFMRDNSCGLAEDRNIGLENFEFESDAEREAADMTEEATNAGALLEAEQSGSDTDVSEDQVGSFEPAVSAALNFKAMLEAALRSSYIPYNDGILSNYNGSIAQLTPTTTIAAVSEEVSRNISEGHTALQWDLNMEQLPIGHTQKSTMPENHFKVVPSGPDNTAELQASSDPTESHKVVSPKKSGIEKEHVTKSIDTIIKVLPGSVTSGGLFDDEHELEEFLDFQKVFRNMNSWSSPTIPDGLFDDVPSPSSRNDSVIRSPGQPYMPMKKETEAQGKDLSNSSSTPQMNPSIHPKGLSSLKYTSHGNVNDLFSFQSSSSGSGPLRESLSVFRKGLFDDDDADDDDDNEDDSGDLFIGSSRSVKNAQSSKETVGNDFFEDPKVKTSDGNMHALSQKKQKSASSRLFEDSRGDADEDMFAMSSQVEQVLMNYSIGLQKDIKDEGDSSVGLEPVTVESKEEYSGRNDSWSSPGVRGGNPVTPLEHSANSRNNPVTPLESERALYTMTTVAKVYDDHHLGTQKDLSTGRESDVGVNSWSSASSIGDILPPENVVKNVVQPLPSVIRDGFRGEESQQWSAKNEGVGLHLLDQRIADEFNTFPSSEENEILIDASAENTNELNIHQVQEIPDAKPLVLKEEVKNVSSEWSRAKSLLQERLNLQPFGPSLQPGATASQSKAFVGDARARENEDRLTDMTCLYHATMSRPRGSSRRRGPTSVRKIPSCRLDADVTSVLPISSTEVEQISPEKQDQAGVVETIICDPNTKKGSEMQAAVSNSGGRLISDNDKSAQMRADAVIEASSPSRDANRTRNHTLANQRMAMKEIRQIVDPVNFRYSESKDVKRMASSPKKDTEESLNRSRFTVVNAEKLSLNSLLFGSDDDINEVNLFGPVQGGTSTTFSNSANLSTNYGKHMFLFGSDEENSGIESKVSLKGAHLEALIQPLQGTPDVVRTSLFDEDDDDDSFT